MDKSILNDLCCPTCKKDMICVGVKESKLVTGLLLCENCHARYEIIDGIPILLPEKLSEKCQLE